MRAFLGCLFLFWLLVFANERWANAADPRIFQKVPVKQPKVVGQRDYSVNTPEFEQRIVDLFSKDKCASVRVLAPTKVYARLSPLIAAVVAYCQDDPLQAEVLFAQAESLDPNRDTIYVLHARYRWKRNPDTALPLWAKVVLITRNRATRLLAQQYLAGIAAGDELIEIGKTGSIFVNVQLGLSRETNPLGNAVSSTANPSMVGNAQLVLQYARNTGFGSLTVGYTLLNNRYLTAHSADLLENDVEVPIAVRAGASEDLVFRPFGSYLTLGDQPYWIFGGFSVRGVAYRRFYKQYVQASIYEDWYYRNEYVNQAGVHARFDYNWEFFPYPWFVNMGAYFENVHAARDTDDANALTITYSHNDIGVQAFFEYNLRTVTPGFAMKSFIRNDSDVSTYGSVPDNTPVTKRRRDIMLEATTSLTIPLETSIHLYLWYSYDRTFSNIGITDYTDRNITTSTVGVALKAYVIK